MAAQPDIEAQISALAAAADGPDPEPALRRALTHRSNLLVSRAARHTQRLELKQLTPDLIEAFHRFLKDPVATDPQCWAKLDIAKALAHFELQDAELFFLGLRHQQWEPTWGGRTDTAGNLRGTCALALVQCRDVSASNLLRHLIPLFRDPDPTVQINAARAIEQLGSDSAALLLRLRAELGSAAPELLSACIGGTLRLDGNAALPWVSAFIEKPDETSTEAAFVLAEHRTPEALAHLRSALDRTRDPDLRETLLSAIATTHLPEARAYLLNLITAGDLNARLAANALYDAEAPEDIAQQLRDLGHNKPRS